MDYKDIAEAMSLVDKVTVNKEGDTVAFYDNEGSVIKRVPIPISLIDLIPEICDMMYAEGAIDEKHELQDRVKRAMDLDLD